jgi:hypothetical protein
MRIELGLIGLLFVADGLLLGLTDFRLVWRPEWNVLGAAGALAAIGLVYARWREAPRLAGLAGLGCRIVLFTDAAAILDYGLVGLAPLPLWDARLASFDRWLGLDWLGMYRWLTAHWLADTVARICYAGLGPEFIMLVVWLELSGRHGRALAFWRQFMLAAVLTVAAGVVMPAAGPFVYLKLPVARVTAYAVQFQALRAGGLRLIDLAQVQGLVIFPSFHAALAALCANAARPAGRWAAPVILFNALIVAASPAIGGHYFADIMAGLALAAFVAAAVQPAV